MRCRLRLSQSLWRFLNLGPESQCNLASVLFSSWFVLDNRIYSVRYEAVNAMLLNKFLKEHRKVEEQDATITQLKKEMETVVARLKEQDSKIQKVTDQLEVNKPAPQM